MSPKERQVEVMDARLHVVDSVRRGVLPIITVHGFPGADHMTLRATPGLESLGHRTRVVFYDRRGAGQSGGGEGEGTSLEQHADDLRRVIAALNLERPIVFSHSSGSCVALMFALEHPAELSGLVLTCARSTANGDDRSEFEGKVGEMLEDVEVDVGELLRVGGHDPDVALHKAMEEIFPLGFLRFGLSERTFMERVTFSRRAYDQLWSILGSCNLCDRLPELRVPVLVLAGRYDPFVDLARARVMAEMIPGARFVLLHNSAHWPFIEEPDPFVAAVWDWVEEVAAHIV